MPPEDPNEYKHRLYVKEELEKERALSQKSYAVKLVERVLWALLALAFVGLVSYFISTLTKPPL